MYNVLIYIVSIRNTNTKQENSITQSISYLQCIYLDENRDSFQILCYCFFIFFV